MKCARAAYRFYSLQLGIGKLAAGMEDMASGIKLQIMVEYFHAQLLIKMCNVLLIYLHILFVSELEPFWK